MENNFELSKEESKIINLMTEGYTHKEIAGKIGKKLDDVAVIVTRLKRNCGCRSSVQLVAKLFREQLLSA